MTTWCPQSAVIDAVVAENDETRTFTLRPEGDVARYDAARPGQFAMLSIAGVGEAAFTLSALARAGGARGRVVLTVRRVGRLTTRLFALAPGAVVGLRGPYGHGFPDDDPARPTLYAAGGCGLSPLKAAIDVQIAERPAGTSVAIVVGSRSPALRMHRAALARWRAEPGVTVIETVDRPDADWRGRTGSVADHVVEAVRALGATRAALCGPPAMLAPTGRRLADAGIAPAAIHVAIERHMQCGVGECGHCYVGHRYACTDGPVFTLAELRGLTDARRETGDAG